MWNVWPSGLDQVPGPMAELSCCYSLNVGGDVVDLGAVLVSHHHSLCGSGVSSEHHAVLHKTHMRAAASLFLPRSKDHHHHHHHHYWAPSIWHLTWKPIVRWKHCNHPHVVLNETDYTNPHIWWTLTLKTSPQMVVPVFRAAGKLYPTLVASASKFAFLKIRISTRKLGWLC